MALQNQIYASCMCMQKRKTEAAGDVLSKLTTNSTTDSTTYLADSNYKRGLSARVCCCLYNGGTTSSTSSRARTHNKDTSKRIVATLTIYTATSASTRTPQHLFKEQAPWGLQHLF
eukprot:3500630-Amphidinium_carterae.1